MAVLREAFERLSRDGWAPLDAHVLMRARHDADRFARYGTRVSLYVAIRRTSHEMTAQAGALMALERVLGMLVNQWERLPLLSESDVLAALSRAIVSLGARAPEPLVRRGGWALSSGAQR